MRALITGGCGFVGKHLAQHLVQCGDDVAVTYFSKEDREAAENAKGGVKLPKIVQTLALDVADKKAVHEVISLLQPDAVFHLAAMAFVPDGEREFEKIFEINTIGAAHVLEAIKEHSPKSRFLLTSSAEVYGDPVVGSLPLTEASVMRPISTYGVTKVAADSMAFKYAFREGLHTVRVRAFPHIGPGQSERFAISGFAKQLAQIKLKKLPPIVKVGNLEAKRDYSDVSDIVRGYREALLNGKRGEAYNLASGTSVSINDILQQLIKISGEKVEIVQDPERMRPVDIADAYGSSAKAYKDFGWKPRISLEAALHGLFAYWIEQLSA